MKVPCIRDFFVYLWEIIMEKMNVNSRVFSIIKLLGKGKGGYSYLVTDGKKEYVLKQIHHEPCSYYQFGDKLQSELDDYKRLSDIGIAMPKLLDYDRENERILKEYIKGETVFDMVLNDCLPNACIEQVKEMCKILYPKNTNIDYFPTNFVFQDNILYYIDFECNDYMEQWNFENWGINYWSKTPEFLSYVEEHK